MPEPDLLGLPIPAQNPLHLAMASTRFCHTMADETSLTCEVFTCDYSLINHDEYHKMYAGWDITSKATMA